jgi:hypothetical protein
MCELVDRIGLSARAVARRNLPCIALAAALVLPAASQAGVLSERDLQKVEALRPLFANLMMDLSQTARRSDMAAGDLDCVKTTIQELMQISDELASYEYLIAMDRDIGGFDEKNPMKDLVKFAADKSSAILTAERKRLADLSNQCARFPVAAGKTQQTLQVIDTTTGILTAIRDRM